MKIRLTASLFTIIYYEIFPIFWLCLIFKILARGALRWLRNLQKIRNPDENPIVSRSLTTSPF